MIQQVNNIKHGLTFPIQLDNGKPIISTYAESIEASIRNLIIWPYNNRYFNRSFGSRLYELIEEPVNRNTLFFSREFVMESIKQWEPRVRIIDVITNQGDTSSKLSITIKYTIKTTNTTNQLTANLIL